MKYSTAIAVLATAVVAAPNGVIDLGDGVKLVPRVPRAAQRVAALREITQGMRGVGTHGLNHAATNNTDASYSNNWAGAVQIGTGFDSVVGTIEVPTPSVPSGSSDQEQYSASAWVGIDGDTCSTAILQTGVDFYAGRGGVYFGMTSPLSTH